MRHIVLVGASALALALGGCGMFHRGESTQSNAGYTPPASSQAQAAPSMAPRAKAQTSSQMEQSGTSTARMTSRNAPGADRQEIMQAQQKLQSDGLYKGKIDGIAGPRTRQAVMAFQKENGLKQTGQLDQQTLAQLTSPSSSSASGTSSQSPTSQSPTAGSTGTSGPTSTTPSNTPPNTSGTTTQGGTQK
jgi:peptidoglycan hydrolase-like protein with peptidoglycan-binding domain